MPSFLLLIHPLTLHLVVSPYTGTSFFSTVILQRSLREESVLFILTLLIFTSLRSNTGMAHCRYTMLLLLAGDLRAQTKNVCVCV